MFYYFVSYLPSVFSAAIPITTIVFTFTPFPIFLIVQQIYLKCKKKVEEKEKQEIESSSEHEDKGSDHSIEVSTGVTF